MKFHSLALTLALASLTLIQSASPAAAAAIYDANISASYTVKEIRLGDADPARFRIEGNALTNAAGNTPVFPGNAQLNVRGVGPGTFQVNPFGDLVGTGLGVGSGYEIDASVDGIATNPGDEQVSVNTAFLGINLFNNDENPVEVVFDISVTYSGSVSAMDPSFEKAFSRTQVSHQPSIALDNPIASDVASLPIDFGGFPVTGNPYAFATTFEVTVTVGPRSNAITDLAIAHFGAAVVENPGTAPLPEPTAGLLFGAGIAVFTGMRRKCATV